VIALTRQERDVLRQEVIVDLIGSDDLGHTFERGEPCEHLAAMRRRYEEALWLADDLGWEQDDPRDTFYVTLPRERFVAWLHEVDEALDEALGAAREGMRWPALTAHRHGATSEQEVIADACRQADRALDVRAVCRATLAEAGAAA